MHIEHERLPSGIVWKCSDFQTLPMCVIKILNLIIVNYLKFIVLLIPPCIYTYMFLGFNLIESIFNHEKLKKLTETNKQELLVWSVLYQTLRVDLTEYALDDKQQILLQENKLIEIENELANYVTQEGQLHKSFEVYPMEYLLLYREYFLDKVFI